jgi:hypothetical protein
MSFHMTRTTLVIDEQRLVDLKRLAAARRQTLSAVVDEFLRQGLERARHPKRSKPSSALPSFPMGKPRVNIADRDQLYEVLERG